MRIAGLTALFCLLAAAASAVHDEPGAMRCLDCHTRLPFQASAAPLRDAVGGVCSRCHAALGHSHPVEVVPSMKVPADLPLDGRGRLTCVTCHRFHDKSGKDTIQHLLRRPGGKMFCFSCHRNR